MTEPTVRRRAGARAAAAPGAGALVAAAVEAVAPGAVAKAQAAQAEWRPRVVLRRPLTPADRGAAGVAGAVVAAAAGLVTYYLATIWRARDPR